MLTQPQEKVFSQIKSAGKGIPLDAVDRRVVNSLLSKKLIFVDDNNILHALNGKKPPVKKTINRRTNAVAGKCLCGCGAPCKGRFQQGHDAKLKSAVLTAQRGNMQIRISELQMEYLRQAPWTTEALLIHVTV